MSRNIRTEVRTFVYLNFLNFIHKCPWEHLYTYVFVLVLNKACLIRRPRRSNTLFLSLKSCKYDHFSSRNMTRCYRREPKYKRALLAILITYKTIRYLAAHCTFTLLLASHLVTKTVVVYESLQRLRYD